jgi:uncharacterized membrane-anchored protein YjiN (DUF445 family)
MNSNKPKQTKRIASFSLAVMGTGFVTTIPFQGSLLGGLLHGGFEAGLVGGLADWFAVTALFRHPLGIPIPHTALLPKNRQRMTDALVSMIINDWLSKESIQDKMKQIHITEKLLPILEKEIHSDAVKKGIVNLADQLIQNIQIEKLTPFIEKEIKSSLSSIEISKMLQSVINKVLNHEYEEKVLDYALNKVEEWVKKDTTSQQLGKMALRALDSIELDGFMRFALMSFQHLLNEEKLGSILQNFLHSIVSSLHQTDNPNRKALISFIRTELQNIKDNKKLVEQIEHWKEQLLAEWEPAEKITETLKQIQEKVLAFVHEKEFMDTYVFPHLTSLLNYLKEDPAKISIIENWLQKQIANLVEANHSKIGEIVRENLDKLDNDTLIHMMENKVGKDLQWIRVNGAICGFLIGIILSGLKALL